MANLMTVGLTNSLLTAYNHAKLATKPMTQASNELSKLNPDMGKVQNGMQYGTQQLSESEEAKNQAGEELEIAQKIASEEEKINVKVRLEEKSIKPSESSPSVSNTDKVIVDQVSNVNPSTSETTEKISLDSVEISPDALKLVADQPAPDVIIDTPKVYTKTGSVKVMAATSPKSPQVDVRV